VHRLGLEPDGEKRQWYRNLLEEEGSSATPLAERTAVRISKVPLRPA
jgi:hypothetical protein